MNLSDNYIAGLVDGEGCFYIGISKRRCSTVGFLIRPCFRLLLVKKSEKLLRRIKDRMGVGMVNIKKSNNINHQDQVYYEVGGLKDCQKLRVFFENKLNIKKRDFGLWCKCLNIMETYEQFTIDGVLKIARIRDRMNKTARKKQGRYRNVRTIRKEIEKHQKFKLTKRIQHNVLDFLDLWF